MIFTTENGVVFGPFKTLTVESDRLVCDGNHFPFSVIGSYVVADDSELPPPEVSNADQDIVWEKIKEERDRRKFAGVFAGDRWFHSDTFSRTQWLGMLLMGQALPAYAWSTIDNGEVTTTPALAQQVAAAIAAQDSNLFAVARAKKAEMLVLANPASYNHLAGWPEGYGE